VLPGDPQEVWTRYCSSPEEELSLFGRPSRFTGELKRDGVELVRSSPRCKYLVSRVAHRVEDDHAQWVLFSIGRWPRTHPASCGGLASCTRRSVIA
jgi:hypothetical protein